MTQDYTSMNNPRFLYLAALHQPFPDWVVKEAMPESDEFLPKGLGKRLDSTYAQDRRSRRVG